MPKFEIEIKSLLGSKDQADELIGKMKASNSGFQALGGHKQLNHYFVNGNLAQAAEKLSVNVPVNILSAKDFSVRTRWADGKVIFVIKATVDDTTSSNGTARQEFESAVNLTLEQLDQILLDSGFAYQAKWSRERQDFKFKDLNVSIDKNAGYGYLAEFEKVIDDQSKSDQVKAEIRQIMSNLGVAELNQDRLARMFDFYNKNWQDYYGTEKTFNIE